jgi:phage FluMu protein Com
MNDRQKFLLEDLSLHAQYEILEYSKDNDELREVAIKKGISLPSKDISIFKCKYGMIDEENRNGCTLPRKEVKKALKTLVGKAIDKDHLRKSTIGYWLDAQVDDNDIIAYGAFWKSNFPEDYEDIKKRMKEGSMKISFEAWGDRTFTAEKSYELHNIEFAGGALLFDTQPAFPDAEVMEFSTNRVLEFAKVIENTKTEEEQLMEEAKLNFNYDNETIGRVLMETKCPTCNTQGWHDIHNIDFVNSKVKSGCPNCNGVNEYDLTPKSTIVKKGKKPEPLKIAIKETVDITDSSAKANETSKEGGNIVDELIKKYNKASVEELSKFMDETLASLSAKEVELATLKSEKEAITKQMEESKLIIENAKLETEKIKTEFETVKAELDKRVVAEKAAFVKVRKDELGEEFSKDMTDEDITNDLKFENAKLKKELATLKVAKEEGSVRTGLEAGAKKLDEVPVAFKKQKSISELAFQ